MDRIEKLMRAADPGRDAPPARPFRRADLLGPPAAAARRRRSRRDHLAVWGAAVGVAAALGGGLLVADQWRATPDEPAPPASSDPDVPTDDPATPSPSPTAPAPTAELPNGLVPAHDDVWFEDSEACRALDVATVVSRGADGRPAEELHAEPSHYPVTGCVDGLAGLLMSDRWFSESRADDVVMGILVARWEDGTWILDGPRQGPDGEVLHVYHSWPALVGYRLPGDPTPAERMADQYKALGVDPTTGERLLGPEAVAWTFPTPAETWTPGSSGPYRFLWRGDAAWWESSFARDGVPTSSDGNEPTFATVTFFDPHSKGVARLMADPEEWDEGCETPGAAYRLQGRAPVALESDDGPLAVALVTAPDVFGQEVSRVMLVPDSAPETGERCELPVQHRVGDVVVRLDGVPYQFRSEEEQAEYLASQEFADVVRLASSVTVE